MSARVTVALVSGGRGVLLSDGWAGWGFQKRLIHAAGHAGFLRALAETDPAGATLEGLPGSCVDWPPVGDPFGDGVLDRWGPPCVPTNFWGWADDWWAVGGAVLDFDRQVLTWYVTDEDGSFGTGAS
ncbi:MAG: hypothetical protein FWD11_05690, partial [Micrococcales bacterium]|nr:hypothetical protein [Micrococcales bacterium]